MRVELLIEKSLDMLLEARGATEDWRRNITSIGRAALLDTDLQRQETSMLDNPNLKVVH